MCEANKETVLRPIEFLKPSNTFKKQVKDLPPHVRSKLKTAIEDITNGQPLKQSYDFRKLQPANAGYYRLKLNQTYRLIYQFIAPTDDSVLPAGKLISVRHRNKGYRDLF